MEFSIATLLSSFTDDKLVAPKVLEKKLGLQDEANLHRLQIALDALERIGLLFKDRGKYRRVLEEDVVEAKLRCSSKGFCFAIQTTEGGEDIYVRESHLSNAWNGDRVLVKVTKEGTRRRSPEGQVKVILERANPSILARVKQGKAGYSAVPLDDRLLFEIDLLPEDEQLLLNSIDYLVHVEVLRYPLGQKPPMGRVARVLGSEAEAIADTDIVCCKHDLRTNFLPDLVAAAKDLVPSKLTKPTIKGRLDLRQLLTVAIEPEPGRGISNVGDKNFEQSPPPTPEPQIIENAISLEQNLEGNWCFSLHITDAAHYIEMDSALDREAKRRATTVFLGDLVLPLLPSVLANGLSLVAGKDRLAISIMLTFDGSANLLDYAIRPSVIQVDRLLTYTQVQAVLTNEGEAVPENISLELANMLQYLFFNLSPAIKAQRQQRGSFEILGLETLDPYKDEGRLGAIASYPTTPVRSLLAELVAVANQAVANHFHALGLPLLYCVQSAPEPMDLQDIVKLGNNLKLDMERPQEDEITSNDYQQFCQQFVKSKHHRVLHYLLQGTLKPVLFRTKPGRHFGLAIESGYTRTSQPLGRYGDLVVQRLIHVLADKGRDRKTTRTKESIDLLHSSCHGQFDWSILPPDLQQEWEANLTTLISHINDREKVAIDAEQDWRGLHKAEQMKRRTGEIFTGLITGVQSYGFFVEIDDLLVQGLVHVSSLKDDWYEYRSRYSCLVGRKNRTAYRLGDQAEVQVKNVDYYRQQIDLVTVGDGNKASNEELEDEE